LHVAFFSKILERSNSNLAPFSINEFQRRSATLKLVKVHTMGGSPWAVVRGTIAHGARVEVTKMTSKKQPIS
jgi:hypothetical protein